MRDPAHGDSHVPPEEASGESARARGAAPEAALSLDRALAGPDLSGMEPPDPRRMIGLRRRAVAAAVLQVLYPVFAVFAVGGSYLGVVDPATDAVFVGEVVSSLPGLAAFLYWFAGAYRLADDLSPYPLDTTPGWAVAQFFIPIVSLFMPYQRMREIEEASGARGALLDEGRRSGLLAIWWATWIVSSVSGVVFGGVENLGAEVVQVAALASIGAAIAANVTTALVALHIDAEQQALARAISDAQPTAPLL